MGLTQTKLVDVTCDCDSCETGWRYGTQEIALIADFKNELREIGWVFSKEKGYYGRFHEVLYCPECAKKMNHIKTVARKS
jgi:hypothetical protein